MSRVLLTSLLAATLLVGGCGADQTETAPPAPTKAAKPSTSPSEQPSASPTSKPTAKPRHGGRHKVGTLAPNARPRRTPAAEHLLAPDDLPGFGGAWTLAAAEHGEGDAPIGLCQQTGLGAIGALESAARTFEADDATAVQVVARFGDARSAWRAHEVLTSWSEECDAEVDGVEDVAVPAGVASSYRAELRKRDAGVGILRNGAYLTLVEITSSSYPDGWEPARVAVRRIARSFS